MSRSALDTVTIKTPAQWRCLASPARAEIVEWMSALAPCSLAELAQAMDRPADALYHHVRLLVAAGVIRLAGSRRAGRRSEAVYELASVRLRFDYDYKTGRNHRNMLRVLSALIRQTERNLATALEAGGLTTESPRRDLVCWAETGWADEESLPRINSLIGQLIDTLRAGRKRRHGKLISLLTVLTPVTRSRHARIRSANGHIATHQPSKSKTEIDA